MAMPIPISNPSVPPASNAGTKSITIKGSTPKPAIDSTQHTGVKSVEEQQAETKAEEEKKAKADVENKPSSSTTTQSELSSKQIIASNLESLKPKPETTSSTNTLPKPVDTWKTNTSAIGNTDKQVSNSLNSGSNGQSRIQNAFANPEALQSQLQSNTDAVAAQNGLTTVEQAGLNSSSQQSQGTSGSGFSGGSGGPGGSGGYFNNVVVGNNSGNTTVIGDTSSVIGGGPGIVDGPQGEGPTKRPDDGSLE